MIKAERLSPNAEGKVAEFVIVICDCAISPACCLHVKILNLFLKVEGKRTFRRKGTGAVAQKRAIFPFLILRAKVFSCFLNTTKSNIIAARNRTGNLAAGRQALIATGYNSDIPQWYEGHLGVGWGWGGGTPTH